jgi:CheY-like chemotaxis protein/nitrogen-specific signal transduction histidine kinase
MAIENAQALQDAERARAQERIQRRKAELASRAKDEFLAVVSHELRTPLNAILGWTVILRGRSAPPELDHGLSIIERNARAQAKLVEDVLDVSRIISGKLALTMGVANLADLISTSVETVTPAANAKGIRISVDIEDQPLAITADAARLQQVIWNLLSNSVKFTQRGGAIAVHARRRDTDVQVIISDTGEGIAPSALAYVFEPFQQADASTTRRHGGLGLGLAIVKHLVSAHGGTIVAASDGEGKGATFTLQIPAHIAVAALATTKGAAKFSVQASEGSNSPRLDGLKVLLVDDEPDALEVIGEVLRSQGADVRYAPSARVALDQFATLKPNILLSDIGMPVMDGFSLIRAVRSLPSDLGGDIPTIAITAYARAEDAVRATRAGYQAHITKPIEPDHLLRVLAEVAGRT